MKITSLYSGLVGLALLLNSCNTETKTVVNSESSHPVVLTSEQISSDYVGNGAQWGGYDMVPVWLGEKTLSDSDWAKLFERIDYMRPPFLRIITSPGWSYDNNGAYDEESKTSSLYKILEYAQSRSIEITYGEWGHGHEKDDRTAIKPEWVKASVKFLNHLVNEKGFACIKTVNIINEPNGYWASTDGNYNIWKEVQVAYVEEMKQYNLTHVKLMGPDIAIFDNTKETHWLSNAARDLDQHIGLYDLHVYPNQSIVRSGEYTDMLRAYKKATPKEKRIVLGEIGFKYNEKDGTLKADNEALIAQDDYSGGDSNMMIYQSFYGIDMADAMIQSMIAGYSGALVWDMDDAMYNSPTNGDYNTKKLKRWGFWNILGEEHNGKPEDEALRPHFYPVSLLCRYVPAGSTIYRVDLPNQKGIRAIVAEKDNKHTIALVNVSDEDQVLSLQSELIDVSKMDLYLYEAKSDGTFNGSVDAKGFATPYQSDISVDFKRGVNLNLKSNAFALYSNM